MDWAADVSCQHAAQQLSHEAADQRQRHSAQAHKRRHEGCATVLSTALQLSIWSMPAEHKSFVQVYACQTRLEHLLKPPGISPAMAVVNALEAIVTRLASCSCISTTAAHQLLERVSCSTAAPGAQWGIVSEATGARGKGLEHSADTRLPRCRVQHPQDGLQSLVQTAVERIRRYKILQHEATAYFQ